MKNPIEKSHFRTETETRKLVQRPVADSLGKSKFQGNGSHESPQSVRKKPLTQLKIFEESSDSDKEKARIFSQPNDSTRLYLPVVKREATKHLTPRPSPRKSLKGHLNALPNPVIRCKTPYKRGSRGGVPRRAANPPRCALVFGAHGVGETVG